jgi:alpha-L-arabinofuranosidase
MRLALTRLFAALVLTAPLSAAELHVAVTGDDSNPGTSGSPLRTIQHAADLAQPGDVVTVHEGVYRERVAPPHGGLSDDRRVAFQAAPGEKVEIKGSEIVKNWEKVGNDTWKTVVPNALFGNFNPYADLIHGDWFDPKGREHHTGSVYLDGDWRAEAAKFDDVLQPVGNLPLWFAKVEKDNTTIWAQFKGVDPNSRLVEINVRRTVFYPEKTGVNYITVRGFVMRQAATQWAPPTAEQIGLIGVHWSKGWIIENNEISHSVCTGVSLGKYGDIDNNQESMEGYLGTIDRALKNGWNRDTVGHHIVRNNHIHNCEQAGIVGSFGAAFCTITGNTIHDIHARRLFSGAEMAGIKFHAAVDTQITHNNIYRCNIGVWLDWMAQGTRVSSNLLHDNDWDLFTEVDHGPFLVDNNVMLSAVTSVTCSQGAAYVHNLIANPISVFAYDARSTPFHKPHSTELAGKHDNPCGDYRFYNNLLVNKVDLTPYDAAKLPVAMQGNVYLHGAKPSNHEKSPLVQPNFDPAVKLIEQPDGWHIEITTDEKWPSAESRKLITTELLDRTVISQAKFEHPDGSPLSVDVDFFGKPRSAANPFPGPFELRQGGKHVLKLMPR